jgi:hypothetical protein
MMAALLAVSTGAAALPPQASAAFYMDANSGSQQAAIQQLIQKANNEQVQALAQNNPQLMQDTSTSDYYQELVQNNSDMSDNGVTAIQLVNLTWGNISVNGSQARALTNETWRTTYQDGSVTVDTNPNVYQLVQQSGNWLIQSDAHPGTDVVIPGVTTTTAPQPQQPTAPTLPAGQGQSHNWSGYAATGGKFTSVTGTWTVPQTSGSSLGADATWVGIGGVTAHDLIQAGTQSTAGGNGQVQYQAWVETLPQVSHPVPLTVNPGDSVTVTLNETSPGAWAIDMKDNTTGQDYQTTRQYQSSESSAEWVEEAPSSGHGVVPLDNFGTVSFSAGSTTENGKPVNISASGAKPITMINSAGQALATPSGIGGDGASFSVTRTNTGSAGTPGGQIVTNPFPGGVPRIVIGFGRRLRGFGFGD